MASAYNYNDFRKFLQDRLKVGPQKGYGGKSKLSHHLRITPSFLSQVIAGDKLFSHDQAFGVADFFGLSSEEFDFFWLLLEKDRAASEKLKRYLEEKLQKIRDKSKNLATRLKNEKVLMEADKAVFYSNWTYTVARQLSGIKGYQTLTEIAAALELSLKETREILDFLVEKGLCLFSNEKYSLGPQSTHLPADSPWISSHHCNWRNKSIEQLRQKTPGTLFFTCPLTIAAGDVEKVREKLVGMIEEVYKIVDPSPAEQVYCLNLDWFKVLPKMTKKV